MDAGGHQVLWRDRRTFLRFFSQSERRRGEAPPLGNINAQRERESAKNCGKIRGQVICSANARVRNMAEQ